MTTPAPKNKEDRLRELFENVSKLKAVKEALDADLFSKIVPNEQQQVYLNCMAREVMLSGLNQGGKSTALIMLICMHLTGLYPDWYKGHRFDHPIDMLLGGETGQTTRDLLTDDILGEHDERGKGMLPAFTLGAIDLMRGGLKGEVDKFKVKHFTNGVHDGYSGCRTFAYSQGWKRVQGHTADFVAVDEEPPYDVYGELRARVMATGGRIAVAMTPLSGWTELYDDYSKADDADRMIIPYAIHHATHLSKDKRKANERMWAGSIFERTRLYGEPTVGRGQIYQWSMDMLVKPFAIPTWWDRIIGIDFPHTTGSFAAVSLAIDPEDGCVYLVTSFKEEELTIAECAHQLLKMNGGTTPVAWPHDGGRKDAPNR